MGPDARARRPTTRRPPAELEHRTRDGPAGERAARPAPMALVTAQADPRSLREAEVRRLHPTIGNRSVGAVLGVQARLTVGRGGRRLRARGRPRRARGDAPARRTDGRAARRRGTGRDPTSMWTTAGRWTRSSSPTSSSTAGTTRSTTTRGTPCWRRTTASSRTTPASSRWSRNRGTSPPSAGPRHCRRCGRFSVTSRVCTARSPVARPTPATTSR